MRQIAKKGSIALIFLFAVSLSNVDNALSGEKVLMARQAVENALASASGPIKSSTQVLVVSADGSSLNSATVYAYEFSDGKWRLVLEPMESMLGKNGFALPGEKREGDGKSPSGIFPVGMAFGYEKSAKTRLSYRQSTMKDKWVDDVNSDDYNKWISGETKASSFEKMKRNDNLYKYGFVVEYNTEPIVKGLGSAIFFHVWRAEDKPTAGCVALSEQNILRILEWLDPSRNPKVVMGKEAELSRIFDLRS